MNPPIETIYDNSLTMQYKWSFFYNIPIQYLIPSKKELPYKSLFKIVEEYVKDPKSDFEEVIQYFNLNPTNNISIKEILLIYYYFYVKYYTKKKNIYKLLNSFSEKEEFIDDGDLNQVFINWEKDINIKILKQNVIYEEIMTIIDNLEYINNKEKDLEFSPITINSTIVSFKPKINNELVNIDDGLDIFNRIICNNNVVSIKYNDNLGNNYYKILVEEKYDEQPNYKNIKISNLDTNNINYIYINVWVPNNITDRLNKATKESFYISKYNLESNIFKVISSYEEDKNNETFVIDNIKNSFPLLEFGEHKQDKIKGEFDIYGLEIDETSFLHLILNDEILNKFLYIEEKDKIFPAKKSSDKKRLDVRYHPMFEEFGEEDINENMKAYIINYAVVSITIIQKYTDSETLIKIKDIKTEEEYSRKEIGGYPYLRINIKANNEEIIKKFLLIFNSLFKYYLVNRDIILNELYRKYLPNFNKISDLKIKKSVIIKEKIINKNNLLKFHAPELFVKNFARKCQSNSQPEIISNQQEINYYLNQKLPNGEPYQIMKFPKDNPKWNFICTNEKFPYPGVKVNKDLINKDIFPYIPCCFPSEQMNNPKSHYYNYINDIKEVQKANPKVELQIITNKFLNPGKHGTLPNNIEEVIKNLYKLDNINLQRYGIIRSPNSILHSILTAFQDKNYLNTKEEDKENFVLKIKKNIALKISTNLLKQQMYDYTDDEIKEYLIEEKRFYDPYLIYRALEEFFSIRIYIFNIIDSDKNNLGELELPRFKNFLINNIYDKDIPNLLIIKSYGNESNIKYPQCELIVNYNKDKIKYFFNNIDLISKLYKYVIINYDNNIIIRKENIFKFNKVKQWIDRYGKQRIFKLDNGLIVYCSPLPSENIPLIKNPNKKIILFDDKEVIKYFNNEFFEIYGVTIKDNYTIALWFKDNTNNIFHVLINKTKKYQEYPNIDLNIIENFNISDYDYLLKRKFNIFIEIFKWLYILSKKSFNYFFSNYIYIDNYKGKSYDYYDFSNINRKFPKVKNIEEAFSKLNTNMIKNNKIMLYNNDFAVKLYNNYKNYYNIIDNFNFIDNYYSNYNDFIKFKNNLIFTDTKSLDDWINIKTLSFKFNKIYYDQYSEYPIFIKLKFDEKNTEYDYFMIQHVQDNDLERALNVCNDWNNLKINRGFYSNKINKDIKYNIYSLSKNILSLLSDEYIKSDNIIINKKINEYYSLLKLN